MSEDRGCKSESLVGLGFQMVLRILSESFLEGRVVQKNFALTNACCPIVKTGGGIRQESAGP